MWEFLILGLGIGFCIALIVYYILNLKVQHQTEMVKKQQDLLDSQENMMKERYEKEWAVKEKKLRKEIADQQRATVKGKITEQIISLLKGDVFPYNPADARFLGAPVDYIIFDGYTQVRENKSSEDITIIIADVKTGGGRLTADQRRIKRAVDEKRVKWKTIELPDV